MANDIRKERHVGPGKKRAGRSTFFTGCFSNSSNASATAFSSCGSCPSLTALGSCSTA